MGILSSFILLDAIWQYRLNNDIVNTIIDTLIICDNEAVVDSINKFTEQNTCLKEYYHADADVIQSVIQLRKKLIKQNVIINVEHIKGHQDKGKAPFSFKACLNVEADHLATKSLKLKKT
jgi:hypothetical protein